MTELSESLCLDLSDTLSGNVKLLAHLFKSTGTAVLKTESETEHLFLTLGKGGKHLAKLFLEQDKGSCVRRCGSIIIGDKVAQMAVLLLAEVFPEKRDPVRYALSHALSQRED